MPLKLPLVSLVVLYRLKYSHRFELFHWFNCYTPAPYGRGH